MDISQCKFLSSCDLNFNFYFSFSKSFLRKIYYGERFSVLLDRRLDTSEKFSLSNIFGFGNSALKQILLGKLSAGDCCENLIQISFCGTDPFPSQISFTIPSKSNSSSSNDLTLIYTSLSLSDPILILLLSAIRFHHGIYIAQSLNLPVLVNTPNLGR